MEPKAKNSSTTSNNPSAKTPPPPSPNYSAQEKAQAVLSVWTERCKPAEICRQFNINWVTFAQWQKRAMEGMLQALEPRVNLKRGQALSPRLQALLQQPPRSNSRKLQQRLEQIALAKPAEPAPKTA